MKKHLFAGALAIAMASCGNGNTSDTNATPESQTSDTTNINMGSQAPAGDTGNQINNRAGSYPADTSNQNGNDSVKGTSQESRSTTPGNASGKAGRKQ